MRHVALALVLILLPGERAVAVQQDWLPPAVADGMARQLAERLAEIEAGQSDEQRLEAAQIFVKDLSARLDSWGENGVLGRAPEFPSLILPAAGQTHLDAMARFQLCNLALMRRQADPANESDMNTRLTAVMGLSAVTMAIVYLRHPFVAKGGHESQIEAFLTSPALAPVFQKVQERPDLMEHVDSQCAPLLLALLE